ncbi:hypothetical protein [Actinomadura sp. WMMB 499]|uniref:hypothetical protein n=1 Tax=Actinomadura sp. WMMB 499 TaxID=1219491 RepID=UPI0012485FA6|nr:hypothetical protein [Actinomadura sp. WMMB 499]QFG22567.1 hypothetical protein F7P10_17030 [Actinomadura sp. WMMB 499]
MGGAVPEVWISAADGCDMVRADAVVMFRMDHTGRLTAQLRDEAKVSVTLLEGSSGSGHPPADFHRRLARAIAELADSSGAHLIRAESTDGAWSWISEAL